MIHDVYSKELMGWGDTGVPISHIPDPPPLPPISQISSQFSVTQIWQDANVYVHTIGQKKTEFGY